MPAPLGTMKPEKTTGEMDDRKSTEEIPNKTDGVFTLEASSVYSAGFNDMPYYF